MQRCDLVLLRGDRGGDATVHATAHQNHGLGLVRILVHSFLLIAYEIPPERQDTGF
jgi:hypothetical protein